MADANEYKFQGDGIQASWIPDVGVDVNEAQTFHTKAITAAEGATLVKLLTFPALQTYKVEHLFGTARILEIFF